MEAGSEQMRVRPGEVLAVGLVAGLLVVCVYPSYGQRVERVRQAEARTNLGGVFVAEMAFFADNGRYSDFNEIGFTLPGPHRYTYRAMKTRLIGLRVEPGPVQVLAARSGPVTPENTVVAAGSSGYGLFATPGFTATATANLDDDPVIDQWHINDNKRNLIEPDVNDAPDVTGRT